MGYRDEGHETATRRRLEHAIAAERDGLAAITARREARVLGGRVGVGLGLVVLPATLSRVPWTQTYLWAHAGSAALLLTGALGVALAVWALRLGLGLGVVEQRIDAATKHATDAAALEAWYRDAVVHAKALESDALAWPLAAGALLAPYGFLAGCFVLFGGNASYSTWMDAGGIAALGGHLALAALGFVQGKARGALEPGAGIFASVAASTLTCIVALRFAPWVERLNDGWGVTCGLGICAALVALLHAVTTWPFVIGQARKRRAAEATVLARAAGALEHVHAPLRIEELQEDEDDAMRHDETRGTSPGTRGSRVL